MNGAIIAPPIRTFTLNGDQAHVFAVLSLNDGLNNSAPVGLPTPRPLTTAPRFRPCGTNASVFGYNSNDSRTPAPWGYRNTRCSLGKDERPG